MLGKTEKINNIYPKTPSDQFLIVIVIQRKSSSREVRDFSFYVVATVHVCTCISPI